MLSRSTSKFNLDYSICLFMINIIFFVDICFLSITIELAEGDKKEEHELGSEHGLLFSVKI